MRKLFKKALAIFEFIIATSLLLVGIGIVLFFPQLVGNKIWHGTADALASSVIIIPVIFIFGLPSIMLFSAAWGLWYEKYAEMNNDKGYRK
jgi:hypothetical protein